MKTWHFFRLARFCGAVNAIIGLVIVLIGLWGVSDKIAYGTVYRMPLLVAKNAFFPRYSDDQVNFILNSTGRVIQPSTTVLVFCGGKIELSGQALIAKKQTAGDPNCHEVETRQHWFPNNITFFETDVPAGSFKIVGVQANAMDVSTAVKILEATVVAATYALIFVLVLVILTVGAAETDNFQLEFWTIGFWIAAILLYVALKEVVDSDSDVSVGKIIVYPLAIFMFSACGAGVICSAATIVFFYSYKQETFGRALGFVMTSILFPLGFLVYVFIGYSGIVLLPSYVTYGAAKFSTLFENNLWSLLLRLTFGAF